MPFLQAATCSRFRVATCLGKPHGLVWEAESGSCDFSGNAKTFKGQPLLLWHSSRRQSAFGVSRRLFEDVRARHP